MTLVFSSATTVTKYVQVEPLSGALDTRGGKILRYSTEIAVYLGNGTR